MQFTVEQRFQLSAEQVLAHYTDPTFYASLHHLTKIGEPDVLDSVRSGDLVTMRVRYRFIGSLPSAATAIIDPHKLTWVEETTYDLAAGTSRNRLLPDHYPDRMTAHGTARFVPDPGTTGSIRHLRGELKVRVPLVGGKVEGAIVSGLKEHLEEEARALNSFGPAIPPLG